MKKSSILHMGFFVFFCFFVFWGCGASVTQRSRISACVVHPEQGEDTPIAVWRNFPVDVVLDAQFYQSNGGEQAEEIKAAIATWNRWSTAKGLGPALRVIEEEGDDPLFWGVDFPLESDGCSLEALAASFPQIISIWKVGVLRGSHNSRSCGDLFDLSKTVQATAYPSVRGGLFYGITILMNFAKYNNPTALHDPSDEDAAEQGDGQEQVPTEGLSSFDLQSLALHELGHALGLRHSCRFSPDNSDEGVDPSCERARAIAEIRESTMHPILPFLDSGEPNAIRRTLNVNDRGRINCLY